MQRKVDIVADPLGNKIVLIQDVIFKGKRSLEWADVEAYLKQFVGEVYTVEKTADLVYIGKDLPDEYTHSNYTVILKCIFRKNCASVPEERSAIPLQTEQSSAG